MLYVYIVNRKSIQKETCRDFSILHFTLPEFGAGLFSFESSHSIQFTIVSKISGDEQLAVLTCHTKRGDNWCIVRAESRALKEVWSVLLTMFCLCQSTKDKYLSVYSNFWCWSDIHCSFKSVFRNNYRNCYFILHVFTYILIILM